MGAFTIAKRSCVELGAQPIRDVATCEAAGVALQLSGKRARRSSVTPRPEGCYTKNFKLFFSTNSANAGRSTAPKAGRRDAKQICEFSTTKFTTVADSTCFAAGMEPVDDALSCAKAAAELGLASSDPSNTSATGRPRGCYFKGTLPGNSLFLSVNPLNVDNGGADGREAGCQFQSAILPVNVSDEIAIIDIDGTTNVTTTTTSAITTI